MVRLVKSSTIKRMDLVNSSIIKRLTSQIVICMSSRSWHGTATVCRNSTDVVVNALTIQSDIECLRRLESVPVKEMSTTSVGKGIC